MDKRRKISIKSSNAQLKKIKKSTGKRVCRFCLGEVKPPRRTFCGEECVHNWKIRNDSKYMRALVYERDLGKCAICTVDTRYLKIQWEDLAHSIRFSRADIKTDPKYVAFLREIRMTHIEVQKTFWHADHIIPVFAGGADGGIDNIRSLCVKCHKEVTKKQIKSRKAKI